ncbi:MAG: DMT family transporter [Ignavibacteriaceae bacterium]|jgi:S-adenosylmethionine uptake transporter|nr:DMT family transporter [Ignavibacteriaceae bacterium]
MKNNFKNKSDREKGVLSLVLLALVFASMGLFARYLATGFLLFQQVYLRMLAALVVGVIVFRKQIDFSKYKRVPLKDWVLIILRAVCYSLFGIILFTQAIIITKYANVSFIGSLPMTAVLGFILLDEKFTWKKAFYVLLAFVGVVMISVADYSHLFEWGKGEILTLISTVFFSLSYIARKWQSNLLNNKELTVINFFVAFLAVFLVSIFKGDGLPVAGWDWGLLLAVIGAGTFNTANVFLTNYGFQKVEAVLASNVLTLESFFAIILGFMFYQEVPQLKDLIGGVIITIAVIAMNKLETKQ